MTPAGELTAVFRLMRPRQWPILTAQLAVGVVLAAADPRDPGMIGSAAPGVLVAAWSAWVVMLNGGTLAYNSAYDRDTGPVAYLRRPPTPPAWTAGGALATMTVGAAVGWLGVGSAFGGATASCLVLSVLYSHPSIRLKGRPGFDLLINVVGYGAGTTAAGLLAGTAATSSTLAVSSWWFCAGFGLLFGSLYPLTQIYQLEDDRARGDRTLATALGARRSLDLALILGLVAVPTFGLGLGGRGGPVQRLLPIAALVAWLAHLVWCRWKMAPLAAAQERAMYRALGLWALVDLTVVAAWML